MSKVKVQGQEIKFCILVPNKDSNKRQFKQCYCKTSDIGLLFQKGQGQGHRSNKACNGVPSDI